MEIDTLIVIGGRAESETAERSTSFNKLDLAFSLNPDTFQVKDLILIKSILYNLNCVYSCLNLIIY
jgi:hypothetical protein